MARGLGASFGGRIGFVSQRVRQGTSESQECCIAANPVRNASPDRHGHDLPAVASDAVLAQGSEVSAFANGVEFNIIRRASGSCKSGSAHRSIGSSSKGWAGTLCRSRDQRPDPACGLSPTASPCLPCRSRTPADRAGRMNCFSRDQAAPSDQLFLPRLGERREEPDLDCRIGLRDRRDRRDHPKASEGPGAPCPRSCRFRASRSSRKPS